MKKNKYLRYIAALALSIAASATVAQQGSQYDLLLRNARIVDGTGAPWFRGDVAIKGDGIARIASSINEPAVQIGRAHV